MTTPKANNQAKILSASMEAEGKTLARMFDYSDIALDLTGTYGKSAQKYSQSVASRAMNNELKMCQIFKQKKSVVTS